jgi:hypothetical protein
VFFGAEEIRFVAVTFTFTFAKSSSALVSFAARRIQGAFKDLCSVLSLILGL